MTLGRVSVVLICGLAFLLASTPARNSDLWLHLASGRELSAGRLPDGTDPFSSTTQGVFWVNHSWLSDFVLYQIYKLGDGAALIVVKAVLTTLLAALLLSFRRRGEGMGESLAPAWSLCWRSVPGCCRCNRIYGRCSAWC